MPKVKKTPYAVLGFLSIAPMSGYEIKRLMKKSTNNFWLESDGQLYPALAKLEKEGFINYKLPLTAGVREKKIYCLTKKGQSELKKWLEQSNDIHIIRNEFILKVFFGANVSPEIILNKMRSQLEDSTLKLTQVMQKRKLIKVKNAKSPHLIYQLFTVDYGIEILKGKITWCQNVIRTLKKLN